MEIPILTLNKKLTKVSFADANGRVGRIIKNEQDIYEQVCNQLLDFEL